jgi:hypothetical protein
MKIAYPQVVNKQNAKADIMRTAVWETVEYPVVDDFTMAWDGNVEASARKSVQNALAIDRGLQRFNALSFYCNSKSIKDSDRDATAGDGSKGNPFHDVAHALSQISCILSRACYSVRAVLHISGTWDYSIDTYNYNHYFVDFYDKLFLDGKQDDGSLLKISFDRFVPTNCFWMNFDFAKAAISINDANARSHAIAQQSGLYNCTFNKEGDAPGVMLYSLNARLIYNCKINGKVYEATARHIISSILNAFDFTYGDAYSPPCAFINSTLLGDYTVRRVVVYGCKIGDGNTSCYIKASFTPTEFLWQHICCLVVCKCTSPPANNPVYGVIVSSCVVLDSYLPECYNVFAVNSTFDGELLNTETGHTRSCMFQSAINCVVTGTEHVYAYGVVQGCSFNVIGDRYVNGITFGPSRVTGLGSLPYVIYDNVIDLKCTVDNLGHDTPAFIYFTGAEYTKYDMRNNTATIDIKQVSDSADIVPIGFEANAINGEFDTVPVNAIKYPESIVMDIEVNIQRITFRYDSSWNMYHQNVSLFYKPSSTVNCTLKYNIIEKEMPPAVIPKNVAYRVGFTEFTSSINDAIYGCGTVGSGYYKEYSADGVYTLYTYTWTGDTYVWHDGVTDTDIVVRKLCQEK